MGRPFVPTSVLDARGGFDDHPGRQRARENEAKPAGPLGKPPRHFSRDEKKIWAELEQLAPPGVLGDSDRWAVEIACSLMAKQRKSTITSSERSQLIQILSRMAMTPADRARVGVGKQPANPEKKASPWELLKSS
jgi:hypothetical protein